MRFSTSLVAALAAYVSFAATTEAQTVNQAPTISGSPATAVYTNTTYDFRPTARDPEGRTLTFSIVNRPSWAAFGTGSGRLTGYPKSGQLASLSRGTWCIRPLT